MSLLRMLFIKIQTCLLFCFFCGNLSILSFILGVIPGIIDFVTGNILTLETNAMHVELAKKAEKVK